MWLISLILLFICAYGFCQLKTVNNFLFKKSFLKPSVVSIDNLGIVFVVISILRFVASMKINTSAQNNRQFSHQPMENI